MLISEQAVNKEQSNLNKLRLVDWQLITAFQILLIPSSG